MTLLRRRQRPSPASYDTADFTARLAAPEAALGLADTADRVPGAPAVSAALAPAVDTADLPDLRRITEHDPALARIKARTVRLLAASIRALVRDLRPGSGVQQLEAQSAFIQRHITILRAAYRAAHREGQRDYYDAVSRESRKWAGTLEPDEQTLNRRMAFYAPSVARMAHEAVLAANAAHHTVQASESLTYDAQSHSGGEPSAVRLAGGGGIGEREDNLAMWQANVGARLVLQADLTWSGGQDGYVAAGFGDSANPYQSLWWDLEPTAQHCADCPAFAAGSPYDPPWTQGGNILNATPGDGNTKCGSGCKCSLRYGGGSVPAIDMKRWAPAGAPDLPDGPMAPVPPPSPASHGGKSGTGAAGSPAIPGGTFTDGQKRALDLYRLAEDRWNRVRGDLPELPNFFTLSNPNFEPMRLPPWETLTRQQQRALQQAFEAFAVWQANVPQAWLEFFDEFEG